jgi:hypothetical protein
MVKNILDDIFSDLDSESSVIMPKSIKIKNIKSADTISDATSSFMHWDTTKIKRRDIRQMV